jgi:D-glycero-D-manno-heptose 1,7-bisphosphate phosphatase
VPEGIDWLRRHGYLIVCATNQSGVERGLYTAQDVEAIHARINARLRARGTQVDAFYYCPHAPETGCDCRKPGTGLFERAARDLGLNIPGSAIIGDRVLDVQAGDRLGMLTALVVPPGHEEASSEEVRVARVTPDLRARSFPSAALRILARG